jgi:hypothetical protein
MKVETVKVKFDNEQGFKIVNKSDLSDSDTLYKERKKSAKKDDQAES